MAAKINVLGQRLVIKQTKPWGMVISSIGKRSGPQSSAVKAQQAKFKSAANKCSSESKKFGNSRTSPYNRCISREL